jgi:tetratricopeptide (TPR) repeat protein
MKRPQWITIGIAVLLVIALYAGTNRRLFGEKKRAVAAANSQASPSSPSTIPVDSILFHSKEVLSSSQVARLSELENSITRGDVQNQKIHLYHQLAAFWKDSARVFAPYAWYTAEASRLENSEKSLTFAARLFLQGLRSEQDPRMKQWEALQAKDLFERSLKINPANDSSKVNLGAVYLYGGIQNPMEGISLIREVAAKDSTNIHAQETLGEASLISGQLDKALERFKTIARMHPDNLEAILRVADVYERMQNKEGALEWYQKSLPFTKDKPELRKEVEARITQLKK